MQRVTIGYMVSEDAPDGTKEALDVMWRTVYGGGAKLGWPIECEGADGATWAGGWVQLNVGVLTAFIAMMSGNPPPSELFTPEQMQAAFGNAVAHGHFWIAEADMIAGAAPLGIDEPTAQGLLTAAKAATPPLRLHEPEGDMTAMLGAVGLTRVVQEAPAP